MFWCYMIGEKKKEKLYGRVLNGILLHGKGWCGSRIGNKPAAVPRTVARSWQGWVPFPWELALGQQVLQFHGTAGYRNQL